VALLISEGVRSAVWLPFLLRAPMWRDDPNSFATHHKPSLDQARLLQCSARASHVLWCLPTCEGTGNRCSQLHHDVL